MNTSDKSSDGQSHKTIAFVITQAAQLLSDVSDTAKLDAELLLCHVLQQNKTYLITWSDRQLTEQEHCQFNILVAERQKGRPVAHLIGHRAFWTLDLEVNDSTLIPRPDTEVLIETVLAELGEHNINQSLSGLDLGTGTGAIALALSYELPNSHWLGVDFNQQAVELSKRNKERNNIDNCDFVQSDWFTNVPPQKFDLIVSNPPYIDPDDIHLNQGDVRFEPLSALIAKDKGLSDIKHIVNAATEYLKPNGLLVIEHGYDQGKAVQAIFIQNKFTKVKTIKDLGQNDRITIGYFL